MEKKNSELDSTRWELVAAEFNYIAQTAFQANEDRARVSTFYFLSVGSLIAAVVTAQSSNVDQSATAWVFTFLFGTLSVFGMLTIIQLGRLRAAWFESAKAMNQLKQRCVDASDFEQLPQLFRWNDGTLPPRVNLRSLSFLMAVQVAILSSLMIGAAVYFLGVVRGSSWMYPSIWVGVLAMIPLVLFYILSVRD